jgi:alcohol dehydrogenase class IV
VGHTSSVEEFDTDLFQIGAGFTNDEGQKVAVTSQELAPAGVILDAELTLATPDRLWLVSALYHGFQRSISSRLSSGIRALDHAVGELSLELSFRRLKLPNQKICTGH